MASSNNNRFVNSLAVEGPYIPMNNSRGLVGRNFFSNQSLQEVEKEQTMLAGREAARERIEEAQIRTAEANAARRAAEAIVVRTAAAEANAERRAAAQANAERRAAEAQEAELERIAAEKAAAEAEAEAERIAADAAAQAEANAAQAARVAAAVAEAAAEGYSIASGAAGEVAARRVEAVALPPPPPLLYSTQAPLSKKAAKKAAEAAKKAAAAAAKAQKNAANAAALNAAIFNANVNRETRRIANEALRVKKEKEDREAEIQRQARLKENRAINGHITVTVVPDNQLVNKAHALIPYITMDTLFIMDSSYSPRSTLPESFFEGKILLIEDFRSRTFNITQLIQQQNALNPRILNAILLVDIRNYERIKKEIYDSGFNLIESTEGGGKTRKNRKYRKKTRKNRRRA